MPTGHSAPFLEHIRELRRRVLLSLVFVAAGAGLGYYLYEKLLYVLQLPYGHELYYTTPTGALSFLIKVCLTFGFIVGLPIITYNILAFIGPVARVHTRRMLAAYLLTSVSLAAGGVAFAYFISLPAALHFLVNFGNPESVQALITANEYFNFVLAYLVGFAALFQIPLIIMGINRITPLKPLKLIGGLKYVILLSFIVAAILTPTPDPINQAIMAGPMILLYLLSVGLVAVFGRAKRVQNAPSSQSSEAPLPLFKQSLQVEHARTSPSANMLAVTTSSPKNLSRRLVGDMVLPPPRQSTAPTAAPASSHSTSAIKTTAAVREPKPRIISDFQLPISAARL